MIKALSKYILTLFIFLLGGNGDTHAKSSQDWLRDATIKLLHTPAHCSVNNKPESRASYVRYSICGTNENDKIFSEENKEENYKPVTLKTLARTGSYFTSFYTSTSGGFFYGIKRCLAVSAHWFLSSSSRYIVLRVLRI